MQLFVLYGKIPQTLLAVRALSCCLKSVSYSRIFHPEILHFCDTSGCLDAVS